MQRYIITVLLLFSVNFGFLIASEEYVNLEVKANSEKVNMKFGIHSEATDSVDFDLGEEMIPPLGIPGSGFYPYFVILDILGDPAWSLIDYRPYPPLRLDTIIYKLYIPTRNVGTKVDFNWSSVPDYFKKVILTDAIEDIEIFSVDMAKSSSFTLENENIRNLLIIAIIDSTVNSIKSFDNFSDAIVYPNPASEFIKIETNSPIEHAELIDIFGNSIEIRTNDGYYNLNGVAKGVYFLKIFYLDGNKSALKLIII